jgi:enoyl-CoA hydratase
MRTKSPTSLKLALAQVRAGQELTFDACMRTEFRIVSRIIHGNDFYEGVRAVIVDKDNAPKWRPATLAEVAREEIERYFAPLGKGELDLP